jgi:hypothetical protein
LHAVRNVFGLASFSMTTFSLLYIYKPFNICILYNIRRTPGGNRTVGDFEKKYCLIVQRHPLRNYECCWILRWIRSIINTLSSNIFRVQMFV